MNDIGTQIETISVGELLPTVIEKKAELWRLVQICCVYLKDSDTYELSYSFGNNKYKFITYRLVIRSDVEVPSITQIYRAAFLYENEMSELFGVKINQIAKNYHNRLYRIDEKTPFIEKKEEM